MQVTAQRLEASAFAPFGQVLERPQGRMRHEHAARLFNGRDAPSAPAAPPTSSAFRLSSPTAIRASTTTSACGITR